MGYLSILFLSFKFVCITEVSNDEGLLKTPFTNNKAGLRVIHKHFIFR